MQSDECRNPAGIDGGEAHRYNLFRLAGALPAPSWRNGLSLAFPASDVAALDGNAITPGCIGLLGMAGTLPYAYSEAVARAGASAGAARAFMDLLSAPAVDAFCTAWRAGRFELAPPPALPAQSGTLRARAVGEKLAQFLGVPVHVEQFAGSWDVLQPAQCSTLGVANVRSGGGALLGARLWRLDGAVRVVVGPLGREAVHAFLPGADGAHALARHWAALTSGGPGTGAGAGVSAEATILLASGAAKGASLGAGVRLGHDVLLLTAQSAGERNDLRYRLC